MTNEQLAVRIRAGENVGDNMAILYDQVKDFIHAMAYKYHGQGELEDLEQEGFLALYDAIDHYEADQGVKFLTYASHWIRQRMQKYIQNTGSLCACLRAARRLLENTGSSAQSSRQNRAASPQKPNYAALYGLPWNS
ncbi:hypothetical protein DXB45_17085 [Clostridium sp. OM04-12AA]|nr:sigma-70 family RNA polymerase sigma factor [Clostridium sp. OM04-12AA]RHV47145.1 hypothetical protein DXB45_17085 [Clostridium sp. OM04-12AA]